MTSEEDDRQALMALFRRRVAPTARACGVDPADVVTLVESTEGPSRVQLKDGTWRHAPVIRLRDRVSLANLGAALRRADPGTVDPWG